MAEGMQPTYRGFYCSPDPALAAVDQFKYVKRLMTREGLDFIQSQVCKNEFFQRSLGKDVNWDLAFIEAMGARPDSAVCWLGKRAIGARVFLLLGKSRILMYSGSESLEKGRDGFGMLYVERELLESKIADRSVARCGLELDSGLIVYDGRMAVELLEGRLYAFGFVPEAASSQFEQGRKALVLPSSLREEAEGLNTPNVKWLFHLEAKSEDS